MDNDPYMNDILDDSGFINNADNAIIKVVGVGGGGGNAVNYMFKQNIPGINFVVCNTDQQHLNDSPVPTKVLIGKSITKGLGSGNQPEVGRLCAESDEEEIRHLFEDQTEMVFITAGMGGGTGTGAAPVVAKIAKDAGMLTIGIVTIPFMFEGESKILKALDGAKEMGKNVDALLVINNENLIELYKDLNFFNAFNKVDDTLTNAARSISEIISEHCYINVDFQDVKTVLKDSGTAIISTGYGEGEHRISDAIFNALHSPLLKKHDINTSRRLLLKFSCWKDSNNPLRTEEISEITQFTSKLPPTIDVKWGIADNPEMGEKVKITVLASGFDVTVREGGKSGAGEKETKKIVLDPDGFDKKKNPQYPNEEDNKERIAEIYGSDKVTKQRREAARIKYAVLKPSQFDDHEVIAILEQTPTFNRDSRFNERLNKLSETPARPGASQGRPDTPHERPIFSFDGNE